MPAAASNTDKYETYNYNLNNESEFMTRLHFPTTGNDLGVVFTYAGRLNMNDLDYNTKFIINRTPEGGQAGATVIGVIHVHFYRGSRKVAAVRWKAHDGDENT